MKLSSFMMRLVGLGLAAALLAAAFFVVLPRVKAWRAAAPETASAAADQTTLDASQPDTIMVPEDVVAKLGIATIEATPAPPPAPLKLEGSLFLDPNRLTHVHTRFAGEVVEIGQPEPDANSSQDDPVADRAIRYGDAVKRGQILCVVWSKELGEKKSEMVDALSRLVLDQENLKRLKAADIGGAIPERSLREAEHNVESSLIAVARAERTLRSWRLSNSDIDEIRAEADRIHRGQTPSEQRMRESWARVEVRAAIDGVVVEKNVAVGDVVETTLDLFKIANLTRLDVLAHAYEEDLPMLERLPRAMRKWQIYLKSDAAGAPLVGSFDQIGNIIDPNQHTALVMGWVDNSDARLRVGQFVTAAVDLPANPHETAIPVAALVDDGGDTFIFTQHDAATHRYTRRKVWPTHRRDEPALGNLVYIAADPSAEQRKSGVEPLLPGERVVVSGSIELAAKLNDLEAEARVAAP